MNQRPRRSDPSTRILIGLLAGAAVGLFLGERASVLALPADAYVKLLQMTVLPYVVGSIVASLGSLDRATARAIGLRVGLVLVVLWAVALGTVFLFPLMFPSHETASFFSTTLLDPPQPFDLVSLYIPANPFNSLANNIVPAVVLFSVILGVALMTIPEKARVIDLLRVVNAAVSRATQFVLALTPYGVFAIAAVAAGTLTFEDVTRLEVYLVSYTAVSLLISLWLLPGLVAALTPVPHRALLSTTQAALLTAFMTSSLFAVLPALAEATKTLLRNYTTPTEKADALPDVILPASYNFPHAGKLLSLSFVLFAGWYAGSSVPSHDYVRLATTGLVTLFGSTNAAVPFLLDLFRIPADTFQLFLATGIINSRFGTLTAAVHTVAIALLGSCAVMGLLTFNRRRLVRFGLVTVVLTSAVVGGARLLFAFALQDSYNKDQILVNMQMLQERGDVATVYRPSADVPPLPIGPDSLMDRIRRRGIVRVGYLQDSLPYAFFNARGDLVGFDVEMAYQLARDLGVSLELAPVDRRVLDAGLDATACDLIMSGAVVTADRAARVLFSSAYLDETLAFVVPDYSRAAFSEWAQVRGMPKLRVGIPPAPYFTRWARAQLPGATLVTIDSIDDMFRPRNPPLDAFFMTAERGSAYTLLHPEYSVVVPQPRPIKLPLAYVVAGRDQALAHVVDTWIELKRKDGTIDRLFAHWILGQDAVPRKPRWSIARDVLHWFS